jgi:histidyl-tRNA synthetase
LLFKAPRGTSDLLPDMQKYARYIEKIASELSSLYGYTRVDTPTFEESSLFVRSVGEGTDIVDKEMYSFDDRGGDSMTLRPEGTASICRAYLEHGMHNLVQPVRLHYFCSVFRYERPQAGRYREHHQFGAEAIGDSDPSVDIEIIKFAYDLIKEIGLTKTNLFINSIGDNNCRPKFVKELTEYYESFRSELCEDCLKRIERNPLRLLDCKNTQCSKLSENAPKCVDYLCNECGEHWELVKQYLMNLDIPFIVDHKLVRGLDYYTKTVFEIQPADVGGQSTICGGGRYDALIEQIGGKPVPAMGFATGIERLTLNLIKENIDIPEIKSPDYLVVNIGDSARPVAIKIAAQIRDRGAGAILANGAKGLRGQMRQANSLDVPYVIIIGDSEIENNELVVKDMASSEQNVCSVSDFLKSL